MIQQHDDNNIIIMHWFIDNIIRSYTVAGNNHNVYYIIMNTSCVIATTGEWVITNRKQSKLGT